MRGDSENPTESKVGQRLSDLTTQRVIVIVLCIMLSIPLFDIGTYVESVTSYDNGLRFVYKNFIAGSSTLTTEAMKSYLAFHATQRNPLLYI